MWISLKDFTGIAGLHERTARKVCARCAAGSTWRGARLEVRSVGGGPGGSAGGRYELLLSSLPEEIQAAWHGRIDAPIEQAVVGAWPHAEREAQHTAFSRLPQSIQEEGRRRAAVVAFFQKFADSPTPMAERYAAAGAEAGRASTTVRAWIKKCAGHHQGDWHVVLAPSYQGCTARAVITSEALEFIKAEYFLLTKPSLKPIYRRAQKLAKERGWALPHYSTVKRLIRAEPRWLHVLKREGQDAFQRLFPPQQRDYSGLKVHEMWCADGRKADVFVRWEDGTIGRPIVLAWLDLRSRVVAGFAIGRAESEDLARRSLKTAIERARALPDSALLDNGMGFASKMLSGGVPTRFRFKVNEDEVPGILPLLGVKITWAMPAGARAKPIESFWRTLAQMDKRFPGAYCGHRPDARPEDFDQAKALSIDRYRSELDATIEAYHAKGHRGDAMGGRSPREVYEELVARTIVRQPTKDQLRLCMQAAEAVRLDAADGVVRIHGNRYWTEKLAELDRRAAYIARFDPEDLTHPIALYRGAQFICEAALIQRTGFRDRGAAKDYARARKIFTRTLKEQAAARVDMTKAARWLAHTDGAGQGDKPLPEPKVVTPLRPLVDYRPPAPAKRAVTSQQVLEAVLRRKTSSG